MRLFGKMTNTQTNKSLTVNQLRSRALTGEQNKYTVDSKHKAHSRLVGGQGACYHGEIRVSRTVFLAY